MIVVEFSAEIIARFGRRKIWFIWYKGGRKRWVSKEYGGIKLWESVNGITDEVIEIGRRESRQLALIADYVGTKRWTTDANEKIQILDKEKEVVQTQKEY